MIKRIIDYTFVVFLLLVSGSPLAKSNNDIAIVVTLIISLGVFYARKLKFDKSFLYFLLIFIFISAIQLLKFNVFPIYPLIGLFSKITLAYLIIKINGKAFISKYIKVIYGVTIISLIFWIPSVLSKTGLNLFISLAPISPNISFHHASFIIYNIDMVTVTEDLFRNSGAFWEPGAFGGYLIIALLFNILITKELKNKYNFIFIAGIFSTFSTTAYITLSVLIMFLVLNYKINPFVKWFIFILILLLFYLSYFQIAFLSNKINEQLIQSESNYAYLVHRSRFSSAVADLNDFMSDPIVGRGKFDETRFNNVREATNRNNGTTDLLVIFGLIGFFTYFFYYFKGFQKISQYYNSYKLSAFQSTFLFLIMGFSENYFLTPFFIGFCFLSSNFQTTRNN